MRFARTMVTTWLLLPAGCVLRSPEPLPPRPADVEVDATDIAFPDVSDLNGLEPAPFPVPAGEGVPTSDGAAPEGIDLGGTTIPLALNPRVQFWLDVFTGRERSRFELYLTRQGRFQELIETRLLEKNLPTELVYLALIESGFSPIARSKANAVGMWQFIAGTARIEGLEVSEYLDERRHVDRSTEAAAQHLERLYGRFGSWYLAAAAYNSGEGRVSRALARVRADTRGGHDSLFWRIHDVLPRETRDYVPKLIAATIIGRNRDRFGFGHVVPADPEPVDRVTVPDATDLSVVADAAGAPLQKILDLNPHLPRQMTPPGRPMEVLLPAGHGPTFEIAYAEIPPEKRVRSIQHTVRRGETLSQIARRYGTTVAAIQQANRISRPDRLATGHRLRIPRSATSVAAGTATASTATGPRTYRVQRGDTLTAIARRHGVKMTDLMAWNELTEKSILKPGDRLLIRPAS